MKKYKEYNRDKGHHSQLTRAASLDRNNRHAALHVPTCRNLHRHMATCTQQLRI